MARRLRAGLASFLAASIVVLSPGLEVPRLFAQVIGRAAPVEGIRAVPGAIGGAVGSAPALSPTLSAPSLSAAPLSAAPLAAAPTASAPALQPAAARAASIPEMAKSLAPHIEAAAKAETSANGSATAGREIENVITGGKSAGAGQISDVAGSLGAGAPSLGFSAAASAPSEAPKSGVPAASAPAEGKTVASATSYRIHRFLLKTVAALTGAVNSLPAAGPALTQKLIKQAADKTVVLSDYDDTLAGYNQVLPEDMVSAIQAVKAAGKDFVVISDRGDEKRAHQLTVFESLASLPVETRAGMYMAANSGGRVYRFDEKGEPVRVFEAPALDEASKAKVSEAAEATKARLAEIGAEQHFPSEGNNNPSESWGTYGYAMMLKVGSSNEAVKGAAAILQDELGKRGMDVEVNPRFAKDPANPPYINFSIVTKQTSAAYIAKMLKAEPKDVLVVGDSMYAPHEAKKASWLTRLGEKLSGRALPKTGNRTDANMEKALPGALTLSVGTTGDPRGSNLWVMAGKGPSVTREVLMSVASKTRALSKPTDNSWEGPVTVLALIGLIAAAAAGGYAMISAFAEVFSQAERALMDHGRDFFQDGGMMLGGVLGMAGTLGFTAHETLGAPAESYELARAKAVAIAEARGAAKETVRFVEATASMPVRSGSQWKYTFQIPGKDGGSALVYVDFSRFMGGALDARATVYEGAGPAADKLTAALEPYLVKMGAKVDAESALASARAAQPGMSAGVSFTFDYREEPVTGDKDLWYRFHDDKGAAVSVNARTAETRVDKALAPKSEGGDSLLKRALTFIGLFSLTAAIYGGLYWAMSHAPAAVSDVPTAPGGWEMLFGGTLGGLGLGRFFSKKPAAPTGPTLKASISPASPVDGFSTFVFDAGREAVLELAAKAGMKAEGVRVVSAKLSPRAWGEDWTFKFVSLRDNESKGPRLYSVKVRRTMVSETLVDAYDAHDLGPIHGMPAAFPSSLVGETIKVSPMDVVAKSGDDARTLSLEARWPDNEGPAELVYVIRGEKGRELKAINAATGAEIVTDPYAALKTALVTVGMIAAAIAVYGSLYYAFTHTSFAPSNVQVPEGWQGPIPDNMDIGKMFGGMLGMVGLAGVLKAKPAKVTDEQVRSAANSAISYKGRPWSQTEYNMGYYNALESLKKAGATKAQLAAFEKLCADAPIRGGSFNPWSGD